MHPFLFLALLWLPNLFRGIHKIILEDLVVLLGRVYWYGLASSVLCDY
jgi:hypothetical protein